METPHEHAFSFHVIIGGSITALALAEMNILSRIAKTINCLVAAANTYKSFFLFAK